MGRGVFEVAGVTYSLGRVADESYYPLMPGHWPALHDLASTASAFQLHLYVAHPSMIHLIENFPR